MATQLRSAESDPAPRKLAHCGFHLCAISLACRSGRPFQFQSSCWRKGSGRVPGGMFRGAVGAPGFFFGGVFEGFPRIQVSEPYASPQVRVQIESVQILFSRISLEGEAESMYFHCVWNETARHLSFSIMNLSCKSMTEHISVAQEEVHATSTVAP